MKLLMAAIIVGLLAALVGVTIEDKKELAQVQAELKRSQDQNVIVHVTATRLRREIDAWRVAARPAMYFLGFNQAQVVGRDEQITREFSSTESLMNNWGPDKLSLVLHPCQWKKHDPDCEKLGSNANNVAITVSIAEDR